MENKHLEVEGAIINIRQGLHDLKGRKVTSIEIIPDDRYIGEKMWKVIPKVYNVRVVETNKLRKVI